MDDRAKLKATFFIEGWHQNQEVRSQLVKQFQPYLERIAHGYGVVHETADGRIYAGGTPKARTCTIFELDMTKMSRAVGWSIDPHSYMMIVLQEAGTGVQVRMCATNGPIASSVYGELLTILESLR